MTITSLQNFSYNNCKVRSFLVDSEPWFVAKDVLTVMESSTTVTALESMVVKGLGKEFVDSQPLETNGGTQQMLLLSEAALTFFLSRSRTEMGKQINRWIHSEVLPAIRKTGSYSISPVPEMIAPPRDTVEYIEAAAKLQCFQDSTLKRLLQDCLVDELELKRNKKALPGGAQKKKYTIVKVRAKQLGYTTQDIGGGTSLGRFVHSRIKPAYQEMVGRWPVYHYEITPELDTVIHTFFGANQTNLLPGGEQC